MLHVVNFIVIIALVLIIADAQSTKTLDVSLSTLDERLDVIATEVSNIDKLLAVKIEETVGLAYAKGQFFLDQYFGKFMKQRLDLVQQSKILGQRFYFSFG